MGGVGYGMALAGLVGFLAGYGLRSLVSSRRRKRYAADYGMNPPRS